MKTKRLATVVLSIFCLALFSGNAFAGEKSDYQKIEKLFRETQKSIENSNKELKNYVDDRITVLMKEIDKKIASISQKKSEGYKRYPSRSERETAAKAKKKVSRLFIEDGNQPKYFDPKRVSLRNESEVKEQVMAGGYIGYLQNDTWFLVSGRNKEYRFTYIWYLRMLKKETKMIFDSDGKPTHTLCREFFGSMVYPKSDGMVPEPEGGYVPSDWYPEFPIFHGTVPDWWISATNSIIKVLGSDEEFIVGRFRNRKVRWTKETVRKGTKVVCNQSSGEPTHIYYKGSALFRPDRGLVAVGQQSLSKETVNEINGRMGSIEGRLSKLEGRRMEGRKIYKPEVVDRVSGSWIKKEFEKLGDFLWIVLIVLGIPIIILLIVAWKRHTRMSLIEDRISDIEKKIAKKE